MINLAENGVECDCGSPRVAPPVVAAGELIICAACAKTYRVSVALVPVTWSEVETHFGARFADLCAFEWHRTGVPVDQRRTLSEIALTGGRFAASERKGAVLGVLFVLVVLGAIARAVLA